MTKKKPKEKEVVIRGPEDTPKKAPEKLLKAEKRKGRLTLKRR